ncbi:MAG TPA: VOC family protein [Vineibacter sp.]|nr:VOC family protein [Vineibacter sp.]
MVKQIFVNLPVNDLDKSMAFFKALGFSFNPQFTDKTAACMVMSEHIYAMLLTHDKIREFTKKPIADAHKTVEVLTALSLDSRAKVNEVADKAIKAGASEAYEAKDYGFMFTRSFEDPDGHIWELFWMDPAQVKQG